jgi:uncharacterized protein with HEPN domain
MKYSGWDYIDHMVQTCEELFECMQGVKSARELEESVKTRRAVVMCLLDLGELFTGLGEKEKAEYPCEHWHRIIGFRNRSSHGYHALDFELVYSIAVNRVPPLYNFLKIKQQQEQSQ